VLQCARKRLGLRRIASPQIFRKPLLCPSELRGHSRASTSLHVSYGGDAPSSLLKRTISLVTCDWNRPSGCERINKQDWAVACPDPPPSFPCASLAAITAASVMTVFFQQFVGRLRYGNAARPGGTGENSLRKFIAGRVLAGGMGPRAKADVTCEMSSAVSVRRRHLAARCSWSRDPESHVASRGSTGGTDHCRA
jgi:hypothetical protein